MVQRPGRARGGRLLRRGLVRVLRAGAAAGLDRRKHACHARERRAGKPCVLVHAGDRDRDGLVRRDGDEPDRDVSDGDVVLHDDPDGCTNRGWLDLARIKQQNHTAITTQSPIARPREFEAAFITSGTNIFSIFKFFVRIF